MVVRVVPDVRSPAAWVAAGWLVLEGVIDDAEAALAEVLPDGAGAAKAAGV